MISTAIPHRTYLIFVYADKIWRFYDAAQTKKQVEYIVKNELSIYPKYRVEPYYRLKDNKTSSLKPGAASGSAPSLL